MLKRQKKFTEPVALLSASPGNFRPSALRLLPTALRSDFDLLALRARCKGKRTRWDRSRQEGRWVEKRALCESALGKSCGFPAELFDSSRGGAKRLGGSSRGLQADLRQLSITSIIVHRRRKPDSGGLALPAPG